MHPSAETSRRILILDVQEAGTTNGVVLPDSAYAFATTTAQQIKFKGKGVHQRHTASEGAKLIDRFGVLSTSSSGTPAANTVDVVSASYSGLPASQTNVAADSILLVVGDNNPATAAVAGNVSTTSEGVPSLTITTSGTLSADQLRNNIGFREGDILEVKFTVSSVQHSFKVKVSDRNINPAPDIHESNDFVTFTPESGGQVVFADLSEIKFVAGQAVSCIVFLA